MAVERVAVEGHFRVEHLEIALVGDDQRVDLEHLHVLLGEGFVEEAHQRDALLDLRAFEAEGEGDAAAVEALQARGRINREGEDLLRGRRGDLFDVHAALGGADEGDARGGAIDEKCEVKFAGDAGTCLDVDAVHLLASSARLVRDQRAAKHLLGFFSGFLDRFGQAHAAFFAGVGFFELAFATATGVDLGFDDPEGPVKFACGGFCVFGLEDDAAIADRGAIRAKQRLRLILVDVHR